MIGTYAQRWHLADDASRSLTERVKDWRTHGQALMSLPHPSPRNGLWLKSNPWFETELLPELRQRVQQALG